MTLKDLHLPLRFLLLLLVAPVGALPAQAPPAIQQAAQLLGAGRAQEAARILDSVTRATPELPQGWALQGAALLATRDLDRAIVSLQRALSFPGVRPTVLYNLGLAFGLQGRLDSAFARLHQAKATNLIDLNQLGSDPDAGPIRGSPRYRELITAAAEFADPFVERVRILREWQGDSAGDQFGWIARDVGDVDGDGLHDAVTSAPTARAGAGAVYLLATGARPRRWSVVGQGQDALGFGVERAGDINGDGVPDAVAGAPGGDYVLLLSGRDGSLIRRITGSQAGERFGSAVIGVNDLDGDDRSDLLIGAPLNDSAGVDAGRVYAFSGRTGQRLFLWDGEVAGAKLGQALGGAVTGKSRLIILGAPGAPGGGKSYVYRGLSRTPAFVIAPDSFSVQLGGSFVSVVGDVNGDGVPDLYASDWVARVKGSTTGQVVVHSGADGTRLHRLVGEGVGNGFGIGVAVAGDVDRDGAADLIIGAWQYNGAAPVGGKVYLYSGRNGLLKGTVTGKVMGETLGFDATGIGDIDHDGVPDLLLTSAWSAIHGPKSGRVFVVSGADLLKGGGSPGN